VEDVGRQGGGETPAPRLGQRADVVDPAVSVGATTGVFGAAWAQADLRRVLTTIGAAVLDSGLSVSAAHTAFGADGGLRDPEQAGALRALVHDFFARTERRAA
jgi:chromate reductase